MSTLFYPLQLAFQLKLIISLNYKSIDEHTFIILNSKNKQIFAQVWKIIHIEPWFKWIRASHPYEFQFLILLERNWYSLPS